MSPFDILLQIQFIQSATALGTCYKPVSICATASSVSDRTASESTVGRGGLLDGDVCEIVGKQLE